MIVADLEECGYITRQRVGRRNHYVVDAGRHFRHPHEANHQVGELLDLFKDDRIKRSEGSRLGRSAGAASAAAAAAVVAVSELAGGVPDLPM
jgi:hypothetical protein